MVIESSQPVIYILIKRIDLKSGMSFIFVPSFNGILNKNQFSLPCCPLAYLTFTLLLSVIYFVLPTSIPGAISI